jgi:epidermal growth factor receptor substrate 15
MSSTFSPTHAELALVNKIFAQNDPRKFGVITGDVAVKIFGGAKLPPSTLGDIWTLSDTDNNGFLSRKGVTVAVRLIGWAQKGEQVSQDLVDKRKLGVFRPTAYL